MQDDNGCKPLSLGHCVARRRGSNIGFQGPEHGGGGDSELSYVRPSGKFTFLEDQAPGVGRCGGGASKPSPCRRGLRWFLLVFIAPSSHLSGPG